LYEERVAERLEYVFDRLDREFDFTIDEYIELDRSDFPWATTKQELEEIWRKRLKHEALNLKLAGKDWEGTKETLKKRYKRVKKNIAQYQSEDVFQLLMNSLSESFDPHTNYFSPKRFDNFRIHMSQSLEGIGARLTTENEYTKVVEIVPGGPAAKSNQLHPNDRILGVGQGEDSEIVDVVGWRIDDVVQLIRGKKGTLVRLQLLRAGESIGATTDTIALVRDKIKLEDQSAQSDTIQIDHQGRRMTFGIIDIPAFYSDYEAKRAGDKDYKSTTKDVERLVRKLIEMNVDGIVIDLRHNGGGFLDEAVNLTGLFIEKGPVVQVRDSRGRLNVERDYDSKIIYKGPLAIVVDRLSASASEIFAAAIQDYNRGVVIGGQSFGKGTVQNAIDLNRFVKGSSNELGQLKLTVAKFYRVDGGSTQHTGVIPDISFPSRYSLMDIGESATENALLWD
ncbi:MAG: PDZ domain-containing protein, partial [Calditrichae bacterium]|nr:PDZ domain-containing protein [Calditrichia bacterium]